MLVIGPISSVYDFLTFCVLLRVFHAGEAAVPHRLVRRVAGDADAGALRHPHGAATRCAAGRAAPLTITCCWSSLVGAALPFTPLAGALGFVPLPAGYFLFLAGATATYLLLVEIVKRRLMREFLA